MDDDFARIERIAAEIAAERRRQVTRWGRQDHPSVGPAGTAPFEPVVERWKAVNDARMESGAHSWDAILLEEVFEALVESDPARRRAGWSRSRPWQPPRSSRSTVAPVVRQWSA